MEHLFFFCVSNLLLRTGGKKYDIKNSGVRVHGKFPKKKKKRNMREKENNTVNIPFVFFFFIFKFNLYLDEP